MRTAFRSSSCRTALALCISSLCMTAIAADEAAKEEKSEFVKTYSARRKEFESSYKQLVAELKAAKSAEKPMIRERIEQLRQSTAVKMIELARQQPAHQEAWWPLLWLSIEVNRGEPHDEAIRTLKQHFVDYESLWTLLPELKDSESAETDAYLARVEQHARSKHVRGVACFILAARTQERAQQQGDARQLETATKLYDRILETYPDIHGRSGPLPEMVARQLEVLKGNCAVGKPAPELVANDLDGKEFRLSRERGRVVVLSFSGHWCGPCVSMHPHEKALVSRLAGKPFTLIEINSDDKPEPVREKMREDGLNWRCIHDGSEGPISKAWQIDSWPVFVVIDQEGVIRRRANDAVGEQLGQWVDELLTR